MESGLILLGAAFFLVAALYSSTGHGGASGYIAVMALLGMAPQEIKPIALCMNIVVSLVAAIQFYRAGHFKRALFLPFILGSVPLALLGGYLRLPEPWFNLLLGAVLAYAALQLVFRPPSAQQQKTPRFGIALAVGAAIGLLSGLIGVGGGIFLTPLLLLMGWANPRQAAAVSAPFILLNSMSGLAGFILQSGYSLPGSIVFLAPAALAGGLLGGYLGSRILPMRGITMALSAVLLVAAFKMFYI
jgi:hypothetical protein